MDGELQYSPACFIAANVVSILVLRDLVHLVECSANVTWSQALCTSFSTYLMDHMDMHSSALQWQLKEHNKYLL